MDLSDKTHMDLLDMRREIDQAIEQYGNRSKTKVYSLFVPFDGWHHYLLKKNCIAEINEFIADGDIDETQGIFTDQEFKIKLSYLNEAELEYCRDLHEFNNPDQYK